MARMEDADVRSWLEASRYDLKTGAALLESRRYLYVLFMCQQSLEKILKARITAETGQLAPRIHNLLRLAELARADLTQEERAVLERLSLYYIQSRYPPEVQELSRGVRRQLATALFRETEVLWRKLRRQFGRKR